MAKLVSVSQSETSLTGQPDLRILSKIILAMFSAVGLESMTYTRYPAARSAGRTGSSLCNSILWSISESIHSFTRRLMSLKS